MGNKQNNNRNTKRKTVNFEDKKLICTYYILFVGSSGIGTKTSLIKRIKLGKFIDVTKVNKEINEIIIYNKNNKEFILNLIDSDSTKKEKEGLDSNRNYFNEDLIIMGYDVTNKQSFEEIKAYWKNEIKDKYYTNLVYLLGNKIDLKKNIEVTENEGKEFADKNNIKYFPISVKNNINIQNFIDDLKMNIEIIDSKIPIIIGNPSKESYKVVFLGNSGVGAKTCLINRLVYNKFEPNVQSTTNPYYTQKFINLKNGKKIIIDLWDTIGQEKYRRMMEFFLKDTDCIVLDYDITRRESFNSIKNFWYQYSKDYAKTNLIYLIANKSDLFTKEEIREEEARNYAKKNNMRFFLVSCYNNSGIQSFLYDLVTELIKR